MSGEVLHIHICDLVSKCSKEVKGLNPIDTFISKVLFGVKSVFFDEFYKTVPADILDVYLATFKEFLESYKLHYEKDYFDCDDFALAFKSFASSRFNTNAVGLALGMVTLPDGSYGMHAWNLALLDDGKVVHVEPQLCEVLTKRDDVTLSSDKFKYYLKYVIW